MNRVDGNRNEIDGQAELQEIGYAYELEHGDALAALDPAAAGR